MATKAKKIKRETTVIEVNDRHDVNDLLDTITDLAEKGMAYVRSVGTPDAPTYCVSNMPMSQKLALKALKDEDMERARESLRAGDSVKDVFSMHGLSPADITRIAKQEGIKLVPGWWHELVAPEQASAAS
jgi:hypothetical protein